MPYSIIHKKGIRLQQKIHKELAKAGMPSQKMMYRMLKDVNSFLTGLPKILCEYHTHCDGSCGTWHD